MTLLTLWPEYNCWLGSVTEFLIIIIIHHPQHQPNIVITLFTPVSKSQKTQKSVPLSVNNHFDLVVLTCLVLSSTIHSWLMTNYRTESLLNWRRSHLKSPKFPSHEI